MVGHCGVGKIMRLSVVIPTFNESAVIEATLAALAPLRLRGGEVVVADGGSEDGTPRLAAPLADRVLTTPPGRARQMNAGARSATGDTLLFLHADTRLPAEAEARVADALARHRWGRFNVRLSGNQPALRVVEAMMNLRSRLTGIATGDQAIFVRRADFEAVGGFPDLPLMEDVALSRALKRRGRPAGLRARVVTSSRRWETHGIAPTILLMWRLRLGYFLGEPPERLARRYR